MLDILNADQISKVFSNQQVAVKPVSIKIKKGEIYVIEGKSGSGKSTLLSMLGGMEKPTKGKVYYKGRSFYDMNGSEQSEIRGKSFGFVFQSFHLIPELTVKDNIELPLQFVENTDKIWDTKDLAANLGIEHVLTKKPSYLSGGEQQRVAIARALITNPSILFADEPTGNLDSKTTELIVKLLIQLNHQYKISLVIVTHEKNLIKAPHTLFIMENGYLKAENVHV